MLDWTENKAEWDNELKPISYAGKGQDMDITDLSYTDQNLECPNESSMTMTDNDSNLEGYCG